MKNIFLKYFLILSAIFLLIFNWGYVDWFFNYNTIGENISYFTRNAIGQDDLSINTASAFSTPIVADTIVNDTIITDVPVIIKTKTIDTTKPNYILVPSIGVKAPISFTTSNSQKVFASVLKLGVLHYPASALPGEIGTAIILGHSAPPNWPKINYDSVFNNLKDLKPGDEILISYQGNDYKYLVNKTFWVNKGEDLTPELTFNRSMVLLVSCWPPGKNLKRIVVEAELKQN